MRIVLAPDKFKDCLSAAEVARAMEAGLRRADPSVEIDSCPMADGGEGTVDALAAATGGRLEFRYVTGPLPEMKVNANFAILGDKKTAAIEMSAASGLALLKPGDRDPMRTTTFGTGQLLMAAVALGVSKIILGIGGSATVDGGIGVAQACGLPVILGGGEIVSPGEPLVGADISHVVLIKHGRGSAIEKIKIVIACDVTNPLYGPTGAARIFGPQKGATPQQIEILDQALEQLARRNDKLEFANLPGAGAAGGLGFGMAAFFGATLERGIDIVIDAVHLRERLAGADLCLTGEGRFDSQSASGKTISGVARLCGECSVPCVALAGSIGQDAQASLISGLTAVLPIANPPLPLEQSVAEAPRLLAAAAADALDRHLRNRRNM